MPLVGVITPSHRNLEKMSEDFLPEWLSIEELLQTARWEGPKWSPWQYEDLAAVFEDNYTQSSISVTTILGGDFRAKVIERKEDYIAEADDFWAMLRGGLVHKMLEDKARPGAIAEQKLRATVPDTGGEKLVAVTDLLTPDGDLYDYKLTDNPPKGWYPYRSQTMQVQYNAWVIRHAEEWYNPDAPSEEGSDHMGAWVPIDEAPFELPEVRSCTVKLLEPKGPRNMTHERKQDWVVTKGGRAGEVIQKNQPYVWNDDEVLKGQKRDGRMEHGVIARVNGFRAALDAYPEPPPEEALDVWGGPAEWRCPGAPYCKMPLCTARRWPHGLWWPRPQGEDE